MVEKTCNSRVLNMKKLYDKFKPDLARICIPIFGIVQIPAYLLLTLLGIDKSLVLSMILGCLVLLPIAVAIAYLDYKADKESKDTNHNPCV